MVRNEFLEILTKSGMATLKDVRKLTINRDNESVAEFELLNLETFNEEKFAKVMSSNFQIPYLDLSNAKLTSDTIKLLNKKVVSKYRIIPIQVTASKVTLATFDPSVMQLASEIGSLLKKPVNFIITKISAWKKLYELVEDSIEDLIGTVQEIKGQLEDEDDENEVDIGEDVVTFINKILVEAFIKKASDIHVEPYEKSFRIRFRLDGNLIVVARPPKSMLLPCISRLKILAQLDISEKRKPQDGRIKLSIGGKPIDYRVSSLPTLFGEKVVLRLLDSSNLELDMTKLGFEPKQLDAFKEGIYRPYGMCLVTGPTGSGKTTTLYSAMADLNKPNTNISTAEDPCEFNLEGINQVNVRKEIGLTFASALKAFLRQDPDIIMVGEIRDFEVGEIAIEAALTGHLVLSTLHTNDAPSTITRLLNMGIEPFLVVAALNIVVAQRLLRKICSFCKVEKIVTAEELISVGFSPSSAKQIRIFTGKGCENCGGTGYKGRVAIYEVLTVSPKIRDLIIKNASSDEIKLQAIKEGMKTLRMSALTKVAQGLTTLEEAMSNSASDKI